MATEREVNHEEQGINVRRPVDSTLNDIKVSDGDIVATALIPLAP